MRRLTDADTAHTRRRCCAGILMCLTALALALAASLGCETAFAKTLEEYDAEIAAQQEIAQEKEQAEAEAKQILEEATSWYYKNMSLDSIAEIITGGKSISEAISEFDYMDTIYTSYAQKAQDAKSAKEEAQASREMLQTLREEQAAQEESLRVKRKTIQFPQSHDMPWSSLPYWTGSVARAGCGLCSYTVVIDVLCGEDYDPADMLEIRGDWKGMDGYPKDRTGTGGRGTHAQFTRDTFDVDMYNISVSLSALKEAVSDDETCAIVCARGTAFKNNSGQWRYSNGHFVAVVAYDEDGFHVADSAYTSEEGTDVVYSDKEMRQMLAGTSSITVYSN